jgi:carboxyl-terminal processing protease
LLTIAKYETPSGRIIQRDYSNGELYNYYNGGSNAESDEEKPKGPETKTDSGRSVYGGGGIAPDVAVKPRMIPIERSRHQQKIANPVFAFALDLVNGRVPGHEKFKTDRQIVFDYDLKLNELRVDESVYAAFKKYATGKYKFTEAQIDNEREFIERALRTELVTAAYGSQTSYQVFNEYDDQLQKAIELLPQARQLAIQGERARLSQRNAAN